MINVHKQNGETYQKWHAYGQAKTANMLFAISLAEKLERRGLHAFSLHPGVILETSLGTHIDEFQSLSKSITVLNFEL